MTRSRPKAAANRREAVEKASWEWVEHVEDVHRDVGERHVQLAYRLNYPTHVDPACKKNCKQNPKCYCGLGRAKWLADREKSSGDNNEQDDDDDGSCFERRRSGLPIGLKNLGNTCYVNSFLQIWFHNFNFRNALYSWDPEQDLEERKNKTLYNSDQEYKPEGIIANLQALFAMMEFSNRKAVDPFDFIAKLGLDPQVQQDAQEFSKLFVSLLESNLSNQVNVAVRGMVQSQFCGNYAYVTTCCKCKRESRRPSSFYELDLTLQGNKTLADCMDAFLKEEKLEGDNQYLCGGCGSKQDATRCVRLLDLPTVLNLQLNRFIFDVQTGRKKKLNSFVQFPEELDMSKYASLPTGSCLYALNGVLMHVGAEANHGHYLAHMHEATSGNWFKFSDAQVEPLDSTNSNLGSEKDHPRCDDQANNDDRGKKGNRLSKRCLRSNSAYMLVYSLKESMESSLHSKHKQSKLLCQIVQRLAEKKNEQTSPEDGKKQRTKRVSDPLEQLEENPFPVNFPTRLRALVERDRLLFREQISENRLEQKESQSQSESLHAKMRKFSVNLVYDSSKNDAGGSFSNGKILSDEDPLDEDFEFVSRRLLQKYLENPCGATEKVDASERSSFLCVHGRLNIDLLGEMKVVKSGAADELYTALAEDLSQTLQSREKWDKNFLCTLCVRNRCRKIILRNTSIADAKAIADHMKVYQQSAVEATTTTYWVGKSSLRRWRTIAKELLAMKIGQETREYLSSKKGEEVEPSHAIQMSPPPLIGESDVVKNELEEEEDEANAAAHAFNEDIVCLHGNLSPQASKKKMSVPEVVWKIFRSHFPDCPVIPSTAPICEKCMDNEKYVAIVHEENREVAAAQRYLFGDILNDRNRPSWAKASLNKVYLIPRSFVAIWRVFVRNPGSTDPIASLDNSPLLCRHGGLMFPLRLDTESDYESVVYMVSEDEWKDLSKSFKVDREIIVRRHREGPDLLTTDPAVCESCIRERNKKEEERKLNYSNEPIYVRKLLGSEVPPECDLSDPDFEDQPGSAGGGPLGKRQKVSNKANIPNDPIRRSNRRQKVRGEREFFVSSDMLLRDFKVKIMEVFKVPPFDQNLMVQGKYLTDSRQTLGQLRILPKSLIYLRADEPAVGSANMETEDCWSSQNPEEGFKGTGLLSGY